MKRILFVDDESYILAGLCRSLRTLRAEWEMVFAEGGAAALRECAAVPFDAVVSDARMPGMEGAELLAEVRRLYPDTIRIILSGQCSRSSVMNCVGVAHQFLSKPCDAAMLKSTVQRVCAMRESFGDGPIRKAIACVPWLPAQAKICQQLSVEIESEKASIESVAEIIGRDVALGAKVVQLVSSGFFGTPQRVTSVAHAAMLLGLDTVKALWESSAVFHTCSTDGREAELHHLTQHSLAVAAAARHIAETMTDDRTTIGDSYLAGMLHEVGTLALMSAGGQCSAEVNSVAGDPIHAGRQGRKADAARSGSVSGADCGGYLAALWGLPDPVVQAIGYHRIPGSRLESTFGPLLAVHVANALLEPSGELPAEDHHGLDMEYLQRAGCAGRLQSWRDICTACQPEGVFQ